MRNRGRWLYLKVGAQGFPDGPSPVPKRLVSLSDSGWGSGGHSLLRVISGEALVEDVDFRAQLHSYYGSLFKELWGHTWLTLPFWPQFSHL